MNSDGIVFCVWIFLLILPLLKSVDLGAIKFVSGLDEEKKIRRMKIQLSGINNTVVENEAGYLSKIATEKENEKQ